MLKAAYSELLQETRRYGIDDGLASEMIEEYEIEYGYGPRTFGDLLEVLE